MRFDGKLSKWNDERGFGFVTPAQGGQDVFVHISSFPRDGQRPQLQEALSFEIELDKKGQKRAVSLRRPTSSQTMPRRQTQDRSVRPARSSSVVRWIAMVLLVVLGVYGYAQYAKRAGAYYVPADAGESLVRPAAQSHQPVLTNMRCDGRQHCSQMTSCTEAKFFLKNCPGVTMDGNHDGVPCEQQWCTSPFAN
ncbi:MAG: cold shock domain-containing protein [Pseudomonadota bacterium]